MLDDVVNGIYGINGDSHDDVLPQRCVFIVDTACDEEGSDYYLHGPRDWHENLDAPVVEVLPELLFDVGEEPGENEPAMMSSMVPGVQLPCPLCPFIELRVCLFELDAKDLDGLFQKAILYPQQLDKDRD